MRSCLIFLRSFLLKISIIEKAAPKLKTTFFLARPEKHVSKISLSRKINGRNVMELQKCLPSVSSHFHCLQGICAKEKRKQLLFLLVICCTVLIRVWQSIIAFLPSSNALKKTKTKDSSFNLFKEFVFRRNLVNVSVEQSPWRSASAHKSPNGLKHLRKYLCDRRRINFSWAYVTATNVKVQGEASNKNRVNKKFISMPKSRTNKDESERIQITH